MSLPEPVTRRLRIDWSDQDVFGHVNNIAILRFVQTARVGLWEATGTLDRLESHGVGPVLAETACRFLRPLSYPGHVMAESTVRFVKTTSFGLSHRLYVEGAATAVQAEDVIVMYDFKNAKKSAIDDGLRPRLQRLISPGRNSLSWERAQIW